MAKTINTNWPTRGTAAVFGLVRANFQYIKDWITNVGVGYYGEYEPGQLSKKGRLVVVDGYLCLALEDTYDYPAPQPLGLPFWVGGYSDPIATEFTLYGLTDVSITLVQRYTFSTDGFVTGVRAYSMLDDRSMQYSVTMREDPEGVRRESILATYTPQAIGWGSLSLGQQFIDAGKTYELELLVQNAAGVFTDTLAAYVYSTPNNVRTPSDGQIRHANKANDRLRVAKTDNDGIDRSAALASIGADDLVIAPNGFTWTVVSNVDEGSFVDLYITPVAQTDNQTGTFTFRDYSAATLQYGRANNHFQTNANVFGYELEGGATEINLNKNGYTLDLEVQQALISDSWKILT